MIWYSVFRSRHVASHTIRNGYVSVHVSEAFDCSNPIIDAIECSAVERATISFWLPRCLASVIPAVSIGANETVSANQNEPEHKKLLRQSLHMYDRFSRVLRPLTPLGSTDLDLLQRIIQDSALDENSFVADSIDSILVSCE